MGESNPAPQGTQEDLNSSIITESQAAAMSPDCWVPVELSLSLSLSIYPSFCLPLSLSISLFLALGIAVDYGAVPGLWLLRYGEGQIHTQTYTRSCTHIEANTQTWRNTNTQTGIGTHSSLSLIYLPHMFPIRVKLLPERAITAEAFTSGEPNYLSDTTFPFSTCPWHFVHLHFPHTYRLKHTL